MMGRGITETYVRMLDVPVWFLSAVRASEWNYLGITRLGFRAIIVVFDDALRDQEAIEYFELPLQVSAYPLATTSSNGLVAKHAATKSARLRALTRMHHEQSENEDDWQHEKGPMVGCLTMIGRAGICISRHYARACDQTVYLVADNFGLFDKKADNPPIKALAQVRLMATREGYCYQHVQAITVAIG
jgi:hypothetical protein